MEIYNYNNLTCTENGALSLSSTLDDRLNLFFKTVRDVGSFTDKESNQNLYDMIDKSFCVSPMDTIKILMNWRDCRGGKGDHRGFLVSMAYLSDNYPEWFLANFKLLHEYGSYLDYVKLWHLVGNEQIQNEIMEFLVNTLRNDIVQLVDNFNPSVSLLAKWFPSEKYKWDRYNNNRFVFEFCRKYFRIRRVDNNHLKMLRQNIIKPLRNHINTVETKMCSKTYNEIEYSKVPSVAMNKYKNAFRRNDSERFNDYLLKVSQGKQQIKSGQVYPHDLVRQYLNNPQEDQVIEEQWKEIKKKIDTLKVFENSIVVCDVSGSMEGTPMEVAIALGLLGLYENKLITFSETPNIHYVPDGSLLEQVTSVKKMHWGFNTNFSRVMDLVLGLSARKPHEAIKKIYIFSDMQFDAAIGSDYDTHFQMVKDRFKYTGIEMPQIIFWNLRGNTGDFPVKCNEQGVVMMSGYSPSLLKGILDGKQITPLTVMMNIIYSKRYDLVQSPHS